MTIPVGRTTAKQFDIFVKEARYWIDRLGLKGWSVEFGHEKLVDKKGDIGWRLTGRCAFIRLSTVWVYDRTGPVTDDDVRQTAFHEVCELFLAKLGMMADGGLRATESMAEEEKHVIIRTLERELWGMACGIKK